MARLSVLARILGAEQPGAQPSSPGPSTPRLGKDNCEESETSSEEDNAAPGRAIDLNGSSDSGSKDTEGARTRLAATTLLFSQTRGVNARNSAPTSRNPSSLSSRERSQIQGTKADRQDHLDLSDEEGSDCEGDTSSRLDWNGLFDGSPTYSNDVLDKCPDYYSAVLYYEQYLESSFMYDSFEDFVGQLAHMHQARYVDLRNRMDIDKAINFEKIAIESLTTDGLVKDATAVASHYDNLGKSLRLRFEQVGDRSDIENAIAFQKRGVDMMPDDHIDKPDMLYQLSQSFQGRFARFGSMEDIDSAIFTQRKAVDLAHHTDKARRLSNLGDLYIERLEYSGDRSDADNAIKIRQEAVDLTPNDDPDMAFILTNLGIAFLTRFQRFDEVADINKATSLQLRAKRLVSKHHLSKPIILQNLGTAYSVRFERFGELEDIDNAIHFRQAAVNATSDTHQSKPPMLSNLGNSLERRYERLGLVKDLDNAISAYRQAISLDSDISPTMHICLMNLGASLLRRFECLGELPDIDEAISSQNRALSLIHDRHPNRPVILSNLGGAYTVRFGLFGDRHDIDSAIYHRQQAVDFTPDGHAEKPQRLNNLSSSLVRRFEKLGDHSDIDCAILIQKQAVDIIPATHADRPIYTMNLGTWFRTRFEHFGGREDINNAISHQRQAVALAPKGHMNEPGLLSNLASALRCRYERYMTLEDLEEAIVIQQNAVDLTPDAHTDKASRLSNSGWLFVRRYERLRKKDDFEGAMKAFCLAATSISGRPITRFYAAQHWASLLASSDALKAYHVLMDLIPRIVWLGRTVHQRYEDLTIIDTAVNEAASAACKAGKLELALEWLEQGRSIVWSQILQLRSPMDALRAVNKELARELAEVAAALETAGSVDNGQYKPGVPVDVSLEQTAQTHRRLAENWEHLLKQVRDIPGFEDFLSPKPAALLKQTACDGPVIVVNVGENNCDALILKPGSPTLDHVHLPRFGFKKAKAAQRALLKSLHGAGVRQVEIGERASGPANAGNHGPLNKILGILWLDVVEPILDQLQYLSPQGVLPHITWCLTGPMTSLPLHAAGLYDIQGPQSKLFHYAISSYTPSLTAMLEASRKSSPLPFKSEVLAVTQMLTPGLSILPGTMKEADEVQKQVTLADRPFTRLDGERATVAAVSEGMNIHGWVHLSCHGKQDTIEPTKSAFHLYDGTLELAAIMKKPLKHAELAYLSACQTASGDANLPDESIHLAAGMFIAGYKTVIATLWSIRDSQAPLVADAFYQHLLNHPEEGAARALHEAVNVLRKLTGPTDFMAWVPYIHIGQ